MVDTVKPETKLRYYTLTYKIVDLNTKIYHKNFEHFGNRQTAIESAKKHCEIMGYIFIHVDSFIINLRDQENSRLRGEEVPHPSI